MSTSADLISTFFERAARHPDSPALVSHGNVYSYGRLAALVQGTRAQLLKSGVEPGQIVGVCARNNPGHLALILALADAGTVSVPLRPEWDDSLKVEIAGELGLERVVAERAEWGIDGLPITLNRDALQYASPENYEAPFPVHAPGGRIFFSSGSTGKPKAVLFEPGYLAYRIRQTLAVSQMSQKCRVLCGNLNDADWCVQALATLFVGGTLVFPVPTIWNLCKALAINAITHARLTPSVLTAILGKLGDAGTLLPSLAQLEVVGAAATKPLLDTVRRKMTDRVFVTYGVTEFGSVSIAGPDLLATDPQSVGEIVGDVTLEVVDQNDEPVPAGDVGTLRLRAPFMVKGYFSDWKATQQHFRNGWFYPGDGGRLDETGQLTLSGRIDDLAAVDASAFTFRELEEAAMEFPEVTEAVALRINEGTKEQRLMVAVTSRQSLTGLLDFLTDRFGQNGPDGIARLEQFPRTFNGKIARAELRKALEAVAVERPGEPVAERENRA
jgi:acyl-CoA synthetase (AMP-forming)/AMP-acid ligase II